ncbi:hypothetical protein C8K18_108153 [Paraburkholderia sp. GV068]|nr:hypothetical protein C8K19_108153 [Paraburkholderia sp. GV072]PUB03273.1 hypothetical protein C8K18_108153 [Paraburkholderia sp. GV068]
MKCCGRRICIEARGSAVYGSEAYGFAAYGGEALSAAQSRSHASHASRCLSESRHKKQRHGMPWRCAFQASITATLSPR